MWAHSVGLLSGGLPSAASSYRRHSTSRYFKGPSSYLAGSHAVVSSVCFNRSAITSARLGNSLLGFSQALALLQPDSSHCNVILADSSLCPCFHSPFFQLVQLVLLRSFPAANSSSLIHVAMFLSSNLVLSDVVLADSSLILHLCGHASSIWLILPWRVPSWFGPCHPLHQGMILNSGAGHVRTWSSVDGHAFQCRGFYCS